MIALVSYSDDRMTHSQHRLVDSAGRHGCERIFSWSPGQLSKQFAEDNADVLSNEFGAGFYIWKPYIIWETMKQLQDGDILIYCDSGNEIISSVHDIIDRMDEDIFFFHNNWPHVDWCKGDVLDAILPGRTLEKETQVQASTVFFRVTQRTRDFVKEWMLWLQMPGFCDNSPSVTPNYPSFKESRWDQSVLCCLQIKYGYKTHWFPTTTAHHLRQYNPGDDYPVLLNHHRMRNGEYA